LALGQSSESSDSERRYTQHECNASQRVVNLANLHGLVTDASNDITVFFLFLVFRDKNIIKVSLITSVDLKIITNTTASSLYQQWHSAVSR
jgi:hypothetical protein